MLGQEGEAQETTVGREEGRRGKEQKEVVVVLVADAAVDEDAVVV